MASLTSQALLRWSPKDGETGGEGSPCQFGVGALRASGKAFLLPSLAVQGRGACHRQAGVRPSGQCVVWIGQGPSAPTPPPPAERARGHLLQDGGQRSGTLLGRKGRDRGPPGAQGEQSREGRGPEQGEGRTPSPTPSCPHQPGPPPGPIHPGEVALMAGLLGSRGALQATPIGPQELESINKHRTNSISMSASLNSRFPSPRVGVREPRAPAGPTHPPVGVRPDGKESAFRCPPWFLGLPSRPAPPF